MLLFCRVLDSFKAVKAALENYYINVCTKFLFVDQIYQTDARYGGSRLTNLAERY